MTEQEKLSFNSEPNTLDFNLLILSQILRPLSVGLNIHHFDKPVELGFYFTESQSSDSDSNKF